MSKRKTDVIENFGERLAQLRKAAGYSQRLELPGPEEPGSGLASC